MGNTTKLKAVISAAKKTTLVNYKRKRCLYPYLLIDDFQHFRFRSNHRVFY